MVYARAEPHGNRMLRIRRNTLILSIGAPRCIGRSRNDAGGERQLAASKCTVLLIYPCYSRRLIRNAAPWALGRRNGEAASSNPDTAQTAGIPLRAQRHSPIGP